MNTNLREHAIRTINGALAADVALGITFSNTHIGERVAEFLKLPIYTDLSEEAKVSIQRHLESLFTVSVPLESVLDDIKDHQPWLPEWRATNRWLFWDQYRNLLELSAKIPDESIKSINRITDKVLERLEDPGRIGSWDRRGMVVGQVQSGKTSNYIGLISKAADAGYKMIVVLAGSTESLRCQTQQRLDEGFLGWETRRQVARDTGIHRIGVGALGTDFARAMSGTSSADGGDFSRKVSDQSPVVIGASEPMLLVVKKNVHILENVIAWATSVMGRQIADTDRITVQGIPLLLIDDEADYASVNTRPIEDADGVPDPAADPARINGLIRRLLRSFEQSAYVGFTATPYANIFIAPEFESDEYGEDLFPRDFIINLNPPSNYIGPAKVFGLIDNGSSESNGLPLVRNISDNDAWVPDRHRKTLVPGSIPPSLREAISAFVIACAMRSARGQHGVHNSMLIHVTRFVDVQDIIATQVDDYLDSFRRRIRYGEGDNTNDLIPTLKSMYEEDFVPTTNTVRNSSDDLCRETVPLTWEDVEPYIDPAVQRIVVHRVNGTSRDSLQYWDAPDGLSVIAIGGDRLSRGLTLEGLTVSYFLRASKMYDTLMQMGRWFGYHPGYVDACRLYTSGQLATWYRDIAIADQELRSEFDRMERLGSTPREYGLRVKSHSGGLVVTGANKMRRGVKMTLTYSGQQPQPLHFYTHQSALDRNLAAVAMLIDQGQGQLERMDSDDLKISSVHGTKVAEFFQNLHDVPNGVRTAIPATLANYIATQINGGELIEWTVVIHSNSVTSNKVPIAGHIFGLSIRSRDENVPMDPGELAIGTLTGAIDESLDLDERELELARASAENDRLNPGRPVARNDYREARPPRRGLLTIYLLQNPDDASGTPIVAYAPSFPYSEFAVPLEYIVPEWQQEMAI